MEKKGRSLTLTSYAAKFMSEITDFRKTLVVSVSCARPRESYLPMLHIIQKSSSNILLKCIFNFHMP